MSSGRNALLHAGPIASVAAWGPWAATAGYDNRVILWDLASGQALAGGAHDHLVNHCAFSHDGRWLVSAGCDASARVWSLPQMRLHTLLHGHGDDVDMAVFSPDDQRIATCALDRLVRIFDRKGRCLHTLAGHSGNVLSLAWTPDGRALVSSSVDGTLRRWCADTGRALSVTTLAVRSDSVEIAPDGTLYAGDDDGRLAVLAPGEATPRFIAAHAAGIKKLVLDRCGERLLTLSYDRTVAVWQTGVRPVAPAGNHPAAPTTDTAALPTLSHRSTLPAPIWARAAVLLDDGRLLAGSFGGRYAVFDTVHGNWDLAGVAAGDGLNALLRQAGQTLSVGDAGVVRADGQVLSRPGSLCNFLVGCGGRVFTGGQLGQLFDAHSGEMLYQHRSPLNCATAFQRDGLPHLALGSYTGELVVLALLADGRLMPVDTLAVYGNAVKGVCASGGLLFSVCASTDIAWHRIADLSLLRCVPRAHERIANACCTLGPRQFASVGRDRMLRLWHGEEAEAFPSPHAYSVKCMAADASGRRVLTGSYGGTLALFDVAQRRWTAFTRPTQAGISAIAWDEGQGRFLAASYDGGIYPFAVDDPAVA